MSTNKTPSRLVSEQMRGIPAGGETPETDALSARRVDSLPNAELSDSRPKQPTT
jgi:hypothetical protein